MSTGRRTCSNSGTLSLPALTSSSFGKRSSVLRDGVIPISRRPNSCSASPGTRCAVTHGRQRWAARGVQYPSNDPGPPLKGAECSAPAAAVVRRRSSARRGRGQAEFEGTRTIADAGRNDALGNPTRTAGACTVDGEPAPPMVAAKRSTAEHSARTILVLELCHVRRQRVGPATSPQMKAPASPAYLWSSALSLCEYSMGHRLLLVGSLERTLSGLPRLRQSCRSLPPATATIATGPLPRLAYPASGGMVAAPFVPRPLATHRSARDQSVWRHSDEP